MRHLITAALPYANGPVHIGHLAGCYLPADIYVRFLKNMGEDVVFICGSDEHGVPITIKAKKEGITPQQVVDKYHQIMGDAFREFGINFSYYGRTSDEVHHQTASEFFKKLYDDGVFVEEITEQYFDAEANQFLADRYITGTCPSCANPKAYGDQCENCGKTLSPQELINPTSTLSGAKPTLKPTRNWYLPLDKMQPNIEQFINDRSGWKTNVAGQVKSWLNQGLQPRAMTRDLDWGVKLPAGIPDSEGKVLYVWFDAPIGYISATKAYFEKQGKSDDWKNYWTGTDSRLVHFIGKDNIVFHCIIFPAMLMAHGNFVLPENVPANEFLNLEGDKISTSRNHAVWLHEYLNDFPNKQDELRYVLTSIAPETKDSDFSWKDFQQRVNSELVAILGNFVNRVMVLSNKYYEGRVPSAKEIEPTTDKRKAVLAAYEACHTEAQECLTKMIASLKEYRFREAQSEMMNIARCGNKFLADTEPWKLIKEDAEAVEAIMSYALAITGNIALAAEPFLPHTSAAIFEMMAVSNVSELTKQFWGDGKLIDIVSEGHQLSEAKLLFKNIEDAEIQLQLDRLSAIAAERAKAEADANFPNPAKSEVTFDDFGKMDLRVSTILEAERVPKTDKLMKILLDTGLDKRTVVSGIALDFTPEEIVGKQVVLLANLAPRKMKGIESQGMILMAKDKGGKLQFVSPTVAVANGSDVA